jgi:glycosyltransferase involved in cell wall biosynthesis
MSKSVVIIGPGYPLRGGIANSTNRLCKQFLDDGYSCSVFSFSLQYPSFIFPGKSQYTTDPPAFKLDIYSVINSIHPLNWLQVGNELKRMKPDIVVVRFWLPLMGPALGTILRRIKKNKHTRIIALTDNIIPHEKRFGDVPFTRYFLKSCDAVVAMSENVLRDMKSFGLDIPSRLVPHPLYDHFGDAVTKEEARKHLGLKQEDTVLLFFGFIRKYKGLDLLLEALKQLKDSGQAGYKLLVAGEFYEDFELYKKLISDLGIGDQVILHTHFIPDQEVRYYFCAADVVVQPYRTATQSGVTPLAYHYEKPMIVTNVGGLPAVVPHEKAGLVCEPEPSSIARAIQRYFQLGEQHFIPHLCREKEKYSWHHLVETIDELAGLIQK